MASLDKYLYPQETLLLHMMDSLQTSLQCIRNSMNLTLQQCCWDAILFC